MSDAVYLGIFGLLGTLITVAGGLIAAWITAQNQITKSAAVAADRAAEGCPNCPDKDLQIQALQKLLIGQLGSGGVTPLRREQHDT